MAGCPPLRRDRRLPRASWLLLALAIAAGGCGGGEDPVEGQGYSYEVPDGWEDATDEAKDHPDLNLAGIRADTLVIGEREEGFTSNVNVLREPGVPDGMVARDYAEASIAGLRDPAAAGFPPEVVETLERLRPRQITPTRDIELAGEEAATWSYTTDQRGIVTRIRQVASVRDGTAYTLTLTALRDRFDEDAGALDEIVDSWQWE